MDEPLDNKSIDPNKLGFFKTKDSKFSGIFLARKMYWISKPHENENTFDITARGVPNIDGDGKNTYYRLF